MDKIIVTSYNKKGKKIKTKDVVLKNDKVYEILKKYLMDSNVSTKKEKNTNEKL